MINESGNFPSVNDEYTQMLKNEYCEQCGLDPNKPLDPKDFNDFTFSMICVQHNAFYDVYRDLIFGEFSYE